MKAFKTYFICFYANKWAMFTIAVGIGLLVFEHEQDILIMQGFSALIFLVGIFLTIYPFTFAYETYATYMETRNLLKENSKVDARARIASRFYCNSTGFNLAVKHHEKESSNTVSSTS